MLEPREADLPVLLLVLVVLPLVTYILLGIWSESGKKKARINMLAQLAAEEALRVEYVTPVTVTPTVPSSKIAYQCAKCFAPATTRCSKCKSVRYCSGKCQIMHWRLGHKQECQQLAIGRSLSLCGDSFQFRPYVENSKQFLGNDINESLHGDFHSDVSSDASLTTSDITYDTASERRFSDSDKQIRSKSKKEIRSNGAAACAFQDTVITGADTPLGNELGNGSFTTCFEVKRSHDSTSTQKNVTHQTNKIMGGTKNINKPRCAVENPENGVNGYEAGTLFNSEEFSSSNEALDLNLTPEDTSVKGSLVYKRPPYTLGSTTPLTRRSVEQTPRDSQSQGIERNAYIDDESRDSSACASSSVSSIGGPQTSGSRKSSKVHKRISAGLIHDCSNNKMLFPYEDLVKYFQSELWGISPRGLLNCGNSCYANAVLQCLTSTKPLMVYLLRRSHSRACRVRDWCLMCELEQHVSMLREGGGPLSPSRLLSKMRNIGCRMGGGNQEDAHEFLRLLVMSMQSICLEGFGGEKEVNPRLQETTLIQQIFGGRLKSKVKCLRCHLESERYENIMDLTLEIHGWVESLEDALTQFTASEDLDGENMYRCGRCATYVKARKQLRLHEVPNILTIVLKRFQTGKYGKINKCVAFPDMLDMIPFMTGSADSPPLYMLYGVVVHLDTLNASFSGHYVSYVKDMQGTWFRIDDSEVQVVSLSDVMSEGAYMLFYSRSFPRPPRSYNMEKEKAPLHAATKTEKTSRTLESLENGAKHTRPREQKYSDSVITDFSDATSSDWSLFTSSDGSSFTTESTRDSFSTVDHGDTNVLDPISSIFAPPFYAQEYPQNNTISCTKFSPCKPQTRFFSEGRRLVLDSSLIAHPHGNVHLGCRSNCNL